MSGQKLGRPPHPKAKEAAEYAVHYGAPRAAEKYSISIPTVYNYLNSLGLRQAADDATALRNRKVAEYAVQHGVKAAAKEYSLGITTVYSYLKQTGLRQDIKAANDQHRREIAAYAHEHGAKAAAEAYQVDRSLVYHHVFRYGKRPATSDDRPAVSPNSFRILKEVLDGHSRADVASRNGVTRQRVHQIIQQARKGGFDV